MGKSKEIIVDSKQSKEPSKTKTKKSKKDQVDITEPVIVVETKKELHETKKEVPETKPKKEKKDKSEVPEQELVTAVETKKEVPEIKPKKGKKDKSKVLEQEPVTVVENKKELLETKFKKGKKNLNKPELVKNIVDDNKSSVDDSNNLDTIIPKSSAITNPEFIILKNKWYDLTKKIENLNNERDALEIEKNNFVSEMCKIIEKHQPKVENLLEQKTTTIGKATISSKLLENDSDDSDSSDSDDEIPIKKNITSKKVLAESSDDDDSDSD